MNRRRSHRTGRCPPMARGCSPKAKADPGADRLKPGPFPRKAAVNEIAHADASTTATRRAQTVPHRLLGEEVSYAPVSPDTRFDWCHPCSITPLTSSVVSTPLLVFDHPRHATHVSTRLGPRTQVVGAVIQRLGDLAVWASVDQLLEGYKICPSRHVIKTRHCICHPARCIHSCNAEDVHALCPPLSDRRPT